MPTTRRAVASRIGPGRLPASLTPLIGRAGELDVLAPRLCSSRLLTLVGPGGAGKTRLGLALAERAACAHADGARFVDLTGSSGGELATALCARLGLRESPGGSALATVIGALATAEILLVLDGLEGATAEGGALVEELLGGCAGLRLLVTSREVLGAAGEVVAPVGGLALPGPGEPVVAAPACELFLERAAAQVAGYAPHPLELEILAELCRRLDGLPLALELAAARVGVMGLGEIAARLDAGVDVLRHPRRSAPARHQTLRATLAWSHGLLTPNEQVCFRRLSVFAATFSLLGAEAVVPCATIPAGDVLDLLAGLVAKSLVQVADRGLEHRYRMLTTVRTDAAERLAAAGEADVVRARHAAFHLELALGARHGLDGAEAERWEERLVLEQENLREALAWALDAAPETGCRLAVALWPFWYRRGQYGEARRWLEGALGRAAEVGAKVRAETLAGAGTLAFLQCDYAVASERLEAARRLFSDAGDRVALAGVLQRLGSVARERAAYDEARALHEASGALARELGDAVGEAASLDFLGFAAWLSGDAASARALSADAVARLRALGRRHELAAALVNLGAAAARGDDPPAALAALEEALALSRRLQYPEGVAWSLQELAALATPSDPARARALLAESLTLHAELGDRWRVASVLEGIAAAADEDDGERAALLLGAAAALRREIGAPLPPGEREAVAAAEGRLARRLGDERLAACRSHGEGLPLGAATALAAELCAVPPVPERRAGDDGGLTAREREVLALLADGSTNREIGAALFISAGTAGVHVSNILRKLGVRRRVQAARLARELGLDRPAGVDERLVNGV